jgi:hypothetical protein
LARIERTVKEFESQSRWTLRNLLRYVSYVWTDDIVHENAHDAVVSFIQAKKLNPNSAAARRRRAAQSGEGTPQNTRGSFPESSLKKAQFKGSFGDNFDTKPAAAAAAASPNPSATADDDDDLAFSPRAGNPFPDLKGKVD